MSLPDPRATTARRWSARQLLGALLAGAGTALVIATALAATGIVPLWRPSVPRPPALVEAEAARRAPAAPEVSATATPSPTPPGESPAVASAGPAPSPSPEPSAALVAAPGGLLDRPAGPEPSAALSDDGAALPSPTLAPPTAIPTLTPLPTPVLAGLPPPPTRLALTMPTPTPRPTPVPPPPPPGLPVRLAIPSIRVDTPVIELSTTLDARGVPQWETVPFMAGHYRVTGLVGAPTNVVLSGHVRTRDLGNVFRDLHLLRPGDPVVVYTDQGELTYRVAQLRLVQPADTTVLAPTREPRLTLITCAGEYDFRAQSFTERLVVVGDLVTP